MENQDNLLFTQGALAKLPEEDAVEKTEDIKEEEPTKEEEKPLSPFAPVVEVKAEVVDPAKEAYN